MQRDAGDIAFFCFDSSVDIKGIERRMAWTWDGQKSLVGRRGAGLGYVGLPLALQFCAQCGHKVVGFLMSMRRKDPSRSTMDSRTFRHISADDIRASTRARPDYWTPPPISAAFRELGCGDHSVCPRR